jgi:hypothetical protein
VNASWRLRGNVTGNAAWKTKLLEELLHPFFVLTDVGINLAVSSLEICVCNQRRTAVPRPDHINNIEIIACNNTIEMDAKHVEPRRSSPMPEQAWFDMFTAKRFLEEWIVHQVDLTDR